MTIANMPWLFTSLPSSRGIVRLNIAEAFMLWRYAEQAKVAILEIGRRHGGSTCVIKAANPNVGLTSVDRDPKHDPKCDDFLEMRDVELLVANSRTVHLSLWYDLLFIDGDHSYEGVKADFLNCKRAMLADATVLFHDAVEGTYGACDGVVRFVKEAEALGWIKTLETADSMLAAKIL
jgi:predicted O-methyltransferase YrrM